MMGCRPAAVFAQMLVEKDLVLEVEILISTMS